MTAKQLRKRARESLRGNWGPAIVAAIIAAILGGVNSGFAVSLVTNITERMDLYQQSSAIRSLFMTFPGKIFLLWSGILATAASVLGIVRFILAGAVTLGYCRFTLALVDGREASLGDLFSQFHLFAKAFLMNLLITLFTFLWSLLFVIPGIIMSYSYSMAPYILLEHPELRPMEAIRASQRLMDDRKWRCFCLDLSFIGWHLLNALTLGIGSLWLNPYIRTSKAAFYRQIQREWREERNEL